MSPRTAWEPSTGAVGPERSVRRSWLKWELRRDMLHRLLGRERLLLPRRRGLALLRLLRLLGLTGSEQELRGTVQRVAPGVALVGLTGLRVDRAGLALRRRRLALRLRPLVLRALVLLLRTARGEGLLGVVEPLEILGHQPDGGVEGVHRAHEHIEAGGQARRASGGCHRLTSTPARRAP